MPRIPPLKSEIEDALQFLRCPSHRHRFDRAALRLEKLSQAILNPQPKVKRVRTQNARLVSGSGKSYRIKIALPEDETNE